jgi:hypothetical protein
MLRRKYPFEYELSPENLEKGTRWLTLKLKNIGNDSMHNLEINMHSTDSLQISLRKSSDHIFRLTPDEDRLLSFQVDAHGTTSLYFSIRYFKEGGSFHWDSPWIREQVHRCAFIKYTIWESTGHRLAILGFIHAGRVSN